MALFEVIISSVIIAVTVQLAFELLFAPLRSIPGPLLARFTNLWRLFHQWTGTSEKSQTQLHKRYGRAVRLGPKMVTISDPELVKVIYSSKDKWQKSKFYTINDFMIGRKVIHTTLSVRDEALHSAMTRPVHKLYTVANILRFEPLIDSSIDYFVERLESLFVKPRKACPIDAWVHYVAWDTIAEMTFSRRLGFLEQGRDVDDIISIGKGAHEYMSVVGQIPILDWVLAKNPIKPIGPRGFGSIAAFSAKQLGVRKSGQDDHNLERPDYLDEFLKIQKDTPGTSDFEVITWMQSNVLAGSDTTAIELRAVVYFLAKHPDCQAKLQAELDKANLGSKPQYKDVSQLQYLNAVIHEATRLHPAVAAPLERVVPEGGLKLSDGRIIPAGTIVGINPRVIHRDTSVFGDDADDFKPERWIRGPGESEGSYQSRLRRMRDADLTFGFGKRACSGKNVAIVEMNKIIARLYGLYDIKLVDQNSEWTTQASWFYFNWGMDVYITRR